MKSRSDGSDQSTAVGSTTSGSIAIENSAKQEGGQDSDENERDDGEDDSFLVVDGYQTSVKFVQVSKTDFSSLIPTGTMSPRGTIGLSFGSSRHGKNSTLGVGTADKINDANEKRPFSMVDLPDSTPSLAASPVSTPSESIQSNSLFVPSPEGRSTGAKSKTFGYHSLTSGLSGTMKGLSLNALSEKIGSGFSTYGASEKDGFRSEGTAKDALGFEREIDSASRSPHLKARKQSPDQHRCHAEFIVA